MIETGHEDLTVETIEQTLMELSPEFGRHVLVHVHANEDLRGLKLLEGVLDAVGDVGRHAHLRLQGHVRTGRIALYLFEDMSTLLLVATHVGIVVHHIQRYDGPVQLRVAGHDGDAHQTGGVFLVLHGYENFLVIVDHTLRRQLLVAQRDDPCSPVGDHRRDDARKEDHDDDAVEHTLAHQWPAAARP